MNTLLIVFILLVACFSIAVSSFVVIKTTTKKESPSSGGSDGGDGGSGGGGSGSGDWKKGYATWYNSYPKCCKDSPSYDSSASKSECDDYSGCKYMGKFAGYKGTMSYNDVKKKNIVAFYDDHHQNGSKKDANSWWNAHAKNKSIQIRNPDSGKIMDVDVLDTCGNHDCNNCCSKNSKKGGGYLLDLEGHTAERFWGSQKNGELEWRWT